MSILGLCVNDVWSEGIYITAGADAPTEYQQKYQLEFEFFIPNV
jgi:hypothetical protein